MRCKIYYNFRLVVGLDRTSLSLPFLLLQFDAYFFNAGQVEDLRFVLCRLWQMWQLLFALDGSIRVLKSKI